MRFAEKFASNLRTTVQMRLVVFDIDGTLTNAMEVDATCFVRGLAEVCGFMTSMLVGLV